jgi:hypothetical protein
MVVGPVEAVTAILKADQKRKVREGPPPLHVAAVEKFCLLLLITLIVSTATCLARGNFKHDLPTLRVCDRAAPPLPMVHPQ